MLNALFVGKDDHLFQSVSVILASLNAGCDRAATLSEAAAFLSSFSHMIHLIMIDAREVEDIPKQIKKLKESSSLKRHILAFSPYKEKIEGVHVVLPIPVVEEELRGFIDGTFKDSGKKENNSGAIKRVLVVEDDEWLRDIFCRNLKKAGFAPFAAMDGLQGIAEVERLAPDIICLDMNMPLMGGYELAKELKASKKTRQIPLIAISGDQKPSRAFESGVDAFFPKPVKMDEVVVKIKELLANKVA